MDLSIRLLLTNNCSATCGYCHNEGQALGKSFLSLEQIKAFFAYLNKSNELPTEIILSGGEPTLHPNIGEIAHYCKEKGIHVSIDSHGGHPKRLIKALPYLDEVKLHIDSFNADKQVDSMGIKLDKCLNSIKLAQRFPLKLVINHPLFNLANTLDFIDKAQALTVDCKIIELFSEDLSKPTLGDLNLEALGYQKSTQKEWFHAEKQHRIFIKRCGQSHNSVHNYFVDVRGIRRYLDGQYLKLLF